MITLSVTESILSFISGIGILQGILLATLIYFHPKSDRSVNVFLSLYIFFISCVMTMPFTMKLAGWQNSYFIQPIPLLPGIFLYFYLRSFKETITVRQILPHLIPLLVIFILTYLNLSAMSRIYPDAKEVPVEGLKRPLALLVIVIRTVQQFVYYFLARKTLTSYQRSIQHLFSDTSRIDLQWTRFLVNGYIVLISTFLAVFPLMLRYPEYFNSLFLLNMAVATPYIYMAAYKGFIQPAIWQTQPGLNKEAVEKEMREAEQMQNSNESYQVSKSKPILSGDRIDEIVNRVLELMETEKLYQEPELTLQQLAEKLQYPSYQVSQAINEGLKKNFYDLVNGYRVEEAKRLLLDSKNTNYTILSVGFEAGFNSKTTFNTVFKRFTGLTPSEYRNKHEKILAEA